MFKLDNHTPLILVLYMTTSFLDPRPGLQWLSSLLTPAELGRPPFTGISSTLLEQKLLVKVLQQNEQRLPRGLIEKVGRKAGEKNFKLSFLLPVRPLAPDESGKLNLEFGCRVCGEKAGHRCSRCQSAWYCSARKA